jgi:hypothetical protein
VLARALRGPHAASQSFRFVIQCAMGSCESHEAGMIAEASRLFAAWLSWSAVGAAADGVLV